MLVLLPGKSRVSCRFLQGVRTLDLEPGISLFEISLMRAEIG